MKLDRDLRSALTYSVIGAAATAVIGLIVIALGLFAFADSTVFIVLGFLCIVFALASYMMVSERIRLGDPAAAERPSLIFGIILLIFGFVIGGIFLLFANSKLTGYKPDREHGGSDDYDEGDGKRRWRREETEDEEEPVGTFGYLDPVSHSGPRLTINKLNMKIGRGEFGKANESERNDLRLSEEDLTLSRDQARLRVDPDTKRVTIRHDSDTSKTVVEGSVLVPREWTELKNGDAVSFGSERWTWRFTRNKPSKGTID